jgi:hypothetical protein
MMMMMIMMKIIITAISSVLAIVEATNRPTPGYHRGSPSQFDICDV